MTERNLYAPPKAVVTDIKQTDCSRDGKFVVVPTGSDLPERCIICNADAAMPIKKKKVYWHSPWLYLLLLINILIYALVALFVRKSFEVSVGLCEEHAARRRRRIGLCLATIVGALVAGGFMLEAEQELGAMLAFGTAALMIIPAMFAARKVYPKRITKEYAQLGGCKEAFLASLE